MKTPTTERRDCPLCLAVWDISGLELQQARTYHLSAFHSYAELLEALDVMAQRLRDFEAAARGGEPLHCAGAA